MNAERSTATATDGAATVWPVVVAVLLTSGGVLLLAREAPPPYRVNCQPDQPVPSPQSPIHHLFVIIKENHAFENYFGAFPGVVGNPPNGSFPIAFGSNATVQPYPLAGSSTPDLPHDHASEVIDEDKGRNDLFVAQAAADGAAEPSAAVGYYGAGALPQYYAYAHAYALADRFFSGYLGPTAPNRDFDLAATTDGQTTDSQPPVGGLPSPTILHQLTEAGIPWSYDFTGNEENITPLEFHDIDSDPCDVASVVPISSLAGQLADPVPPAVTFIDPSHDAVGPGEAGGYSEHPPDNVTLGADWTTAIVNAIFASPAGPSSAVLIFYDESGGYWDPVTPPVVNGSPDGFRVPFLVLSGYTPAGLVVSESLDPTAVLSFIDWNWRLPPLTPRVAASPGLGAFFAFNSSPRPPLLLPTPLNLTTVGSSAGAGGERARGLSAGPPPSATVGGGASSARGVGGPELRLGASVDPERRRSFIVRRTSAERGRARRHDAPGCCRHGADRAARAAQRPRRGVVPARP